MMAGFVKIEAERKFAGRHGTEAGDDPVFDELYEYAGELRERVDAYEEVLRAHDSEDARAAESNYVKATFTREEVCEELRRQIVQIREDVAKALKRMDGESPANEGGESIDEILTEMRIFKCRNLKTLVLEPCVTTQTYFADRIERAWKRESERLKQQRNRARLNTIEQLRREGKLK